MKNERLISTRREIQRIYSLNITKAREYCAKMVHSTPRAWALWESGKNKIPPEREELAMYKMRDIRDQLL